MLWIDGVGRQAGQLALLIVDTQRARMHAPLARLGDTLRMGPATRARVATDFASWTAQTAAPFWTAQGISGQELRNGHGVYHFKHGAHDYLVPASVLIAAIMRPIRLVHRYLFSPQGLDAFCAPCVEADGAIGLQLPSYQIFGRRGSVPQGLMATYSWMHCFPSARAMWDSIYQYAIHGRLDVSLPKALATLTLRSVRQGNYHLVTEMSVVSLRALETPYAFANAHSTELTFHESAGLDWSTLRQAKSDIPLRNGRSGTSDDEWSEISPFIERSDKRKYDARAVVDAILEKLATGTPWRKMPLDGLTTPIVQATYQRMTQDGRWASVREALLKSRSQAAAHTIT